MFASGVPSFPPPQLEGIGGLQQWQQCRSERKVAEVIGAEMQLEPVRCGLVSRRHDDAGVIDQHLKTVVAGSYSLAECGNRLQIREIHNLGRHVGVRNLSTDGVRCPLTELGVTDTEDHAQSGTCEATPHFVPDAPGARHHPRTHISA